MNKPNPEEFARGVLWHLAGVRAEVYELHLDLAQVLAHLTERPALEFQERWKKEREEMQRRLYAEALIAAGIDPDLASPDEDPPLDLGTNPRG